MSPLDRWITCLESGCGVQSIPTTVRCRAHISDAITAQSPLAVTEGYALALILAEQGERFYDDARKVGARQWLLGAKAWTEVDWLGEDLLADRHLADLPRYLQRAATEWLHHGILWS